MSIKQSIKNIAPEPLWNELRGIKEQIYSICDQAAHEMNVSGVDVRPEEVINNGPIWVFWGQGLESAPARVKACVDSIKRNAASRDIIVPELFDLAPVIRDSFDSNVWKRLTEHTDAFKLSWKKPSSYPEGSFGGRLVKEMFFDNTEGNAS